ncbi:hypothetical protein EUTSA_v10009256mg [Eutrema salsugineum]|uniref:Uncharacterized protein n=1 Tax=Eutrema salsugineum TaxID=72664 RepID=V4MPQ5_EUTSA|nr:hypothetical protein EUTSA_v10009256mg [Eutrema salsugineum]
MHIFFLIDSIQINIRSRFNVCNHSFFFQKPLIYEFKNTQVTEKYDSRQGRVIADFLADCFLQQSSRIFHHLRV